MTSNPNLRPQTVLINQLSPVEPNFTFKEVPTPYKLRSKRTGWLSKFLWWCLEKRNTLEPYFEKQIQWTFDPLSKEGESIATLMMKAAGRRIDDDMKKPDELLFVIGPEEWRDYMQSPHFADQHRFSVGPYHKVSPYVGHVGPFTIDIHVVPTLKGVACIDKVLIEKEISHGELRRREEDLRSMRVPHSQKREDYL